MSEIDVNHQSVETKLDSVGSMLLNTFVDPMRVFGRIKAKPTWIVPLIIFVIAMGIGTYFAMPFGLEAQKQQINASEKMSPEQKEAALQQMESLKGIVGVIGVGGAMIGGVAVVFLSAALIMLMGNVVFGGTAKYITLVSLTCFTQLIAGLGWIIKTPLIVMKQSIDIRTSLAVLLPAEDTTSILYSLLNTFTDLFFIWEMILAILGVAVIYGFTKQKSAGVILIPVGVIAVVMVLVKLAF